MRIYNFTSNNGLKVIYEHNDSFKSISFGIWVLSGSTIESEETNGISHFIEHMVFKGSREFSREKISKKIEEFGGTVDAYTTKEYTAYYGKVSVEDFKDAFYLLSSMIKEPLFSEHDIENEKKVVIEEINEEEDSVFDVLVNFFYKKSFAGSSLSLPILGTKKSIGNFNSKLLRNFHSFFYQPSNIIITGSGALEFEEFKSIVLNNFNFHHKRAANKVPEYKFTPCCYRKKVDNKELSQVYIVIGFPVRIENLNERFSLSILNHLFGGGINSRLFQRIREELGLSYSISTNVEVFRRLSIFSIIAILSHENLYEFNRVLKEEIEKIIKEGVSKEEIELSKKHFKNALKLSFENSWVRSKYLFSEYFYYRRVAYADRLLEGIEEVDKVSIDALIRKLFLNKFSYTLLFSSELDKKSMEVFCD